MAYRFSRFASAAAIAAAFSLGTAPAAAVELPAIASGPHTVETGAADDANHHHRWRRHHRHRGVDVGDVVTGVLVIGAIAAIADAVDDNRDRRVRDRDYRDRDYRDYRDRDYDYRDDRYDSNGIDNAANMCVDQIERGDDRVEEVTDASRRSDGWHIAGTLRSGEGWSCWIDNDGRIRNVDFGAAGYLQSSAPAYPAYPGYASPVGEQWDDDAYARARATTSTPISGSYAYRDAAIPAGGVSEPQPAYPGGPLPGEEGYGDPVDYSEIDGDLD